MTSATAQWYEVLYVTLSAVAVLVGGRVLWRNVVDLRRLRRRKINGARQAATKTAISSDAFRAIVAGFLLLIGIPSLYAPPNPNHAATVSRAFFVTMAFFLPSLVIWGGVYDERMRVIVKRKIEEAMGMANATDAVITVKYEGDNPLVGLLRSRKFLLAVLALVQAIVLQYFQVPDTIWQAAMALAGIVIAGIALEDYGRNRAEGAASAPQLQAVEIPPLAISDAVISQLKAEVLEAILTHLRTSEFAHDESTEPRSGSIDTFRP